MSDERRLAEATQKAAHWKQQAANLQDIVDAQYDQDQIPLVRRVIMQRREIKAAWQTSGMYQRMWRRDRDKLEAIRAYVNANKDDGNGMVDASDILAFINGGF